MEVVRYIVLILVLNVSSVSIMSVPLILLASSYKKETSYKIKIIIKILSVIVFVLVVVLYFITIVAIVGTDFINSHP